MTNAALTSIALLSPIIASNLVFSARRATKGVDSMEEKPLYGVANMNIACAQVLKGSRAVKSLAIATDPLMENINSSSKNKISEIVPKKITSVMKNPVFKTAGGILDYTARKINPVIVATGAYNVVSSDDKLDTWARESTSLLTMFGFEEAAKEILGMPSFNTQNGKNVFNYKHSKGDNFIKKVLSSEQYDCMQKYLNKNKGTKLAVSSGKGLAFAGASIAGYKLGSKICDSILGEKKVIDDSASS